MRMSFEKHHAFSAVIKMRLAQNETILGLELAVYRLDGGSALSKAVI